MPYDEEGEYYEDDYNPAQVEFLKSKELDAQASSSFGGGTPAGPKRNFWSTFAKFAIPAGTLAAAGIFGGGAGLEGAVSGMAGKASEMVGEARKRKETEEARELEYQHSQERDRLRAEHDIARIDASARSRKAEKEEQRKYEERQKIEAPPGADLPEGTLIDPKDWLRFRGQQESRTAAEKARKGAQQFSAERQARGFEHADVAQGRREDIATNRWVKMQDVAEQRRSDVLVHRGVTEEGLTMEQAQAKYGRVRGQEAAELLGFGEGNEPPPSLTPPPPPTPDAGASIPTVRTPEEARALPPGTKFRTPDGRVKVR